MGYFFISLVIVVGFFVVVFVCFCKMAHCVEIESKYTTVIYNMY